MGWKTEINTLTNEKKKQKHISIDNSMLTIRGKAGEGVVKENGREMGSNTW